MSKLEIRSLVDESISPHTYAITSEIVVAQIASRGRGFGLARDPAGNVVGFKPFNPDKFDIDAFIVSDSLAKRIQEIQGFRSGRANKALRQLSNEIHQEFRSLFPGLKGGKDKFNFRVFNREEWSKFADQSPYFTI